MPTALQPERIEGFAPLLGDRPRVLILGSMPSVASLQKVQYYGKPQNAFWRIMADLIGFDPGLPYEQRAVLAVAAGVAVWDVLASCVRPGSLDSAIQPGTEVVNDIPGLLAAQPTMTHVFFNGRKAEEVFRRHVLAGLESAFPGLRYSCLPSTSPAMATLDFHAKLERWRIVADALAASA